MKLKNKPTSACGRDFTPSRDREPLAEDPGTPGMDAHRHGNQSPELEPAAPQPRRPFPVPGASTPGSPDSCDHATNHELRDLWDRGDGDGKPAWYLPDGEGGVDYRPLSSVSTSAGPTPCPTTPGMTPCPEDRAISSPFPLAESSHRAPGSPSVEEVSSSKHKGGGGGARQKAMDRAEDGAGDRPGALFGAQSQSRKVFVGGVPQDMSQDDLYRFFNEHAPVKKAWLQKYRVGAMNTSNPSNNHRGFGFVIFQEPKAVDDLLGPGPNNSRFLYPPGGGKLEVKRAVSSSDMQSDVPAAPAGGADSRARRILQAPQVGAATAPAGSGGQTAPAPAPEGVRAAPWPTMQMAAAPQAIMMAAPVPWQGCSPGGPTLVQQMPAGFAAALSGGHVHLQKAAPHPHMPMAFQDAAHLHGYGMPSMPSMPRGACGGAGPPMAMGCAGGMPCACTGPCMASEGGVPQQIWMANLAAQVQPHPEVAQRMGQALPYWAHGAHMPVASAALPGGVVPRPQGQGGSSAVAPGHEGMAMTMQQPHMAAYGVCGEAVQHAAAPSMGAAMPPQATAAQLWAAMPDHYDD